MGGDGETTFGFVIDGAAVDEVIKGGDVKATEAFAGEVGWEEAKEKLDKGGDVVVGEREVRVGGKEIKNKGGVFVGK